MALSLCVFALPTCGETPFVKIESPASGTVVHPGERLTVTVDATPFAFRGVMLLPWLDFSFSGPPYRFLWVVPSKMPSGSRSDPNEREIPSGVYLLGAQGVPLDLPKDANPHDHDFGDQIEIDIERSQIPERLTWRLGDVDGVPQKFHCIGETQRLWITGHFAVGQEVDLSRSTLTQYESSSSAVVTVTAIGLVTAVGPGSAEIKVRNENTRIVVPITVPDKPFREHCELQQFP